MLLAISFLLNLDLCCKCGMIFFQAKPTISPALETAVEYQMKLLSIAISYSGGAVLRFKDQLREAISYAFEAPSWKVFIYLFMDLYLFV